MKAIINTALLAALTLPACATESGDPDIEVTAAPADTGKFDAIDGKSFRFHRVEAWTAAEKDGTFPDFATDLSMKVNVATDSTVVVSGRAYGFSTYNWPADTILKISGTPRPGVKTASAMVFVMIDSFKGTAITCGTANVFGSVALDSTAREVYADGKTFTYAQCGFTEAQPSFDVFFAPASTNGALEGTYKYRINASVE